MAHLSRVWARYVPRVRARRDTCLACARLHTLHDNDGRQTVVCVDCGPSIDGDHDGGKYLAEVAHELAEEIIRRIEVEHPDVQVSEN